MTVYVGVSMWPFGRMIMCHMFADTEQELNKMADDIGVSRRYIQRRERGDVHYDISKSKRALAIQNGAVACDTIEDEVDAWERVDK